MALTLWLLALRWKPCGLACWKFSAASANECFSKVVQAQTQKVDHSAKALNALFPKPIGTDAIRREDVRRLPNCFFFPASALWPVWPGQSTVSVGRKLYRSI